jgi:hypothetical protein
MEGLGRASPARRKANTALSNMSVIPSKDWVVFCLPGRWGQV